MRRFIGTRNDQISKRPRYFSQAASDAIVATMPVGSAGYENEVNERGERLIWLPPAVVDCLRSQRGPGGSYSDVILELARQQKTPGDSDAGQRWR